MPTGLTHLTRFRHGGSLLVLNVIDGHKWNLLVLCESGTYWDNHAIACAMTKLAGETCVMRAVPQHGVTSDSVAAAYDADRGQRWQGLYQTKETAEAMIRAMRELQQRR